ncbi:MAG TPA: alpha-hydroxy acid oxidase [Candidatus Baltobacteraceae bacterium]
MSRRAVRDAINVEDLRRLAWRRLPRMVFDYIDGGAEAEVTLRENCEAFTATKLRPRGAVVHAPHDLRATLLGTEIELPILLAPVGFSRSFFPRGECVAARAAGAAGIPYILSTLSGCSIEDVKAATRGPAWFQLYLAGGREAAENALARAQAAGYTALVVTIDTPVAGMRERDLRNGSKQLLENRFWSTLPYVPHLLTRAGWVKDFLLDGGLMDFPNVIVPGSGAMSYADVGAALARSAVAWSDLRWIRETWSGPIVIKGVLTAEDARRAVDEGADAIVVSNHGGRQLDGVLPTLRALPEVVAAVDGRAEVLFDGGIRRGSDIVKALCLGARAVLIGRAYAYGLGAAGGPGVARAITILRTDFLRTLKLLGCANLTDLNPSFLG